MKQAVTIDYHEAQRIAKRALSAAGVPDAYVAIQVDLLIEAELCGRASHGLLRLPRIAQRIHNGVCDCHTTGTAHWKSEAFLEVNGRMGLGPVVACSALDLLSQRVKQTGIALAAIHNNNHLGMLGWYAERVAKEGRALIALSTSEALVHPWGGRKAMLGTNPIAVGVPAQPHPFVIDMATSLVSMGQIHDYAHRGEPMPDTWALDANGEPTNDAVAARDGAIAPFGGPKGYALGLAFEVLVTSLSGAAIGTDIKGTLDATERCNKGDVFIMIDAGVSGAAQRLSSYLEAIRNCPPSRPGTPVLVPGDRARMSRQRRLEEGIELSVPVWRDIVALAAGTSSVN
ncbi:MAG: Ldh family oxidoreductase [Pigmentiphaga sp.]